MFIHSFIHLFIHSLNIQSFIKHSFIHCSPNCSFIIDLFIHTFICLSIRSFIYSFIHLFIHSFIVIPPEICYAMTTNWDRMGSFKSPHIQMSVPHHKRAGVISHAATWWIRQCIFIKRDWCCVSAKGTYLVSGQNGLALCQCKRDWHCVRAKGI